VRIRKQIDPHAQGIQNQAFLSPAQCIYILCHLLAPFAQAFKRLLACFPDLVAISDAFSFREQTLTALL
jgi:hypothetical protein